MSDLEKLREQRMADDVQAIGDTVQREIDRLREHIATLEAQRDVDAATVLERMADHIVNKHLQDNTSAYQVVQMIRAEATRLREGGK